MNSLSRALAATALISLLTTITIDTARAADEHDAHHPAAAAKASSGTPATPAEARSGAMDNMKKMQQQMAAIRAEKDPTQRAKLLDEHMQTMQATTQMMQRDKGCTMMDSGMMKNGESDGSMNMMQMMMDQMMQHQKAMQGSGK